jgi:SAM-dependent methyltransferase
MVEMDVTSIQYPDDCFDVIYCSHVLEHVPDDRAAIRELYRVLKPGGWAILQVPISADATFEDPTVTDPDARERLFGQDDHVRRYGPDYADRLAAAGFLVSVDGFVRELDDREITHFGLERSEDVYFCRKEIGR